VTGDPEFIGKVHAWVATAPEPVLSITGHTGVLTDVRFVWSRASCSWCRRTVSLWSDGGTVETGIRVGRSRQRSSTASAHWYTTFRPAVTPSIPDDCPNPACRRPATRMLAGVEVPTGWLHGAWSLSIGPFTFQPVTDERCPSPANPKTYDLISQVYTTLRATHPDLAAAADADAADQRRRAERA
jgi:hypothetical protein